MNWFEIKIETTSEASEAVSEMLTTLGAGGVAIEDPNDIRQAISQQGSLDYADDELLNSLGEVVIIKAYFQPETNIKELSIAIKEKMEFIQNFLDIGTGLVGYSEVVEEDWATNWKKYYKPIQVSERIVIKPTWEPYENSDEKIVIEMDPGMAFGTGTHETTRLCMEFLDINIQKGDKVLDIGCGTGILGIAAAKLGASSITAVDVDPMAIRITKENCTLNHVDQVITAFVAELKDVEETKCDVIVANIIANVIIDISSQVQKRMEAGGIFIASGIIKERKQDVLEAYSKMGFVCEAVKEMGEWVAIKFKCQDSL